MKSKVNQSKKSKSSFSRFAKKISDFIRGGLFSNLKSVEFKTQKCQSNLLWIKIIELEWDQLVSKIKIKVNQSQKSRSLFSRFAKKISVFIRGGLILSL